MGHAFGTGHIYAAMDRGDPGRTRKGPHDACGAKDAALRQVAAATRKMTATNNITNRTPTAFA